MSEGTVTYCFCIIKRRFVRDKKTDVYIHAEEALRLGIIESVM